MKQSDDKKHIELLNAIGNLSVRMGVLETQTTEISRRIGIQNGRVADSEAAIKKILLGERYEEGVNEGKTISAGRLVTVLTLVFALAAIIVYFFTK